MSASMETPHTLEELFPVIIALALSNIIIPLFAWVKNRLSKDPHQIQLEKAVELLEDMSDRAIESNKHIVVSLRELSKRVDMQTKTGLLDKDQCIERFHSDIKNSMLEMMSLYSERLRKNHIKEQTHAIYGRYTKGAATIAGKLYHRLASYTCKDNGRLLAGFFGGEAADDMFFMIAGELYRNHKKQGGILEGEVLNIEDIQLSFDRWTSILVGCTKKWISDDRQSLRQVWDDIEVDFNLNVEPKEIDFLLGETRQGDGDE